jgi:hypothetical protein
MPVETLPKRILTPSPNELEPNIDYQALKRSLGLERSPEALGYNERAFNTCQTGYGYSSTHDCRRLYFVVINYRLMCRDSEDTVSTGIDREDQMPIAGQSIEWTLKSKKGSSQTDGQGFGQVETVAANSQRTERLKLSNGTNFLYIRANEITKVVTPKSWCQ